MVSGCSEDLQSSTELHRAAQFLLQVSVPGMHRGTSISFPFQTFLSYWTQEIEPETARKFKTVALAVRELPDVQLLSLGQTCVWH